MMTKNMSMTDRLLRAVLIAPVAAVIGVLIGPESVAAIVLYAIAAIMLATAAAGYCPLYALLHVSSSGHRRALLH
jgi:hypothetical protein